MSFGGALVVFYSGLMPSVFSLSRFLCTLVANLSFKITMLWSDQPFFLTQEKFFLSDKSSSVYAVTFFIKLLTD